MTPANQYQLSAFLAAFVTAALVVLVAKKGLRKKLISQFIPYCLSIIGWSFFVGLATTINHERWSFFFFQLCHFSSTFIPIFFLYFVYAFLGFATRTFTVLLLSISLVSFTPFILFFPNLFFSGVTTKLGFPYFINAGTLYIPWMILFFVVVIFSHYKLFQVSLSATGLKKRQLRFFFVGNLIGYLGGIASFLLVYNIEFFPYPYGCYGIVFFNLVTSYSILKHQFLDIEVIIKRTLIFAGLFVFVCGVVSVTIGFLNIYFRRFVDIGDLVSTAIAIGIAMLVYGPVKDLLIQLTDRYLFQKEYDYRKFLKDASKGISQITSLHHLMELVIHFITMKMRLKNAAILVRDIQTKKFKLDYLRGYPPEFEKERELTDQSELVQYLTREKEAIEIDQIEEYIETTGEKSERNAGNSWYDFAKIKREMDEMRAACCVPSFLGYELRNVLILGKKKSGDSYTQEDLNVLFTLAQESAIAIENARLYDEAVNRSRELQKMNEKLQVTQASLIVAEKNATMVGMAKAIGHEVNNPLSALMLNISRVRSNFLTKIRQVVERNSSKLPENDINDLNKWLLEIERRTQKTDRSAQRISAVIHTLTDILKGSKGEMGPLSLVVLCREALEATRFSTYEENLAGCKIVEDITANILVMGNLEQLLQVFVNLIKNSYEAMEKQKDRRITISGKIDPQDSRMARIEISDNGPGIPPEVLPKIWMQGFSTKTRKDNSLGAAGQGQGLFVCKHIIESIHKGMITVESEVGKGTKFIIQLPLAEVGIDV